MKRLLLDTNIYGELVIDQNFEAIIKKIKTSDSIRIYGSKVIRDELRNTPKSMKIGKRSLRMLLLTVYDLISKNTYSIDKQIYDLAEQYFLAYKSFGGIKDKKSILKDFLIVSCATLNNLDIVVSEDEKSMLSEISIKAYYLVNSIIKKKTPKFINYGDFKRWLL
ncbi:MAG: PIN domain-containing protein [Nanoarchaeota archaeon]